VERKAATWTAPDLVVGYGVRVHVDRPGWVVVLLGGVALRGSLLTRETIVRSCSAVANLVTWDRTV
jgi:hypothetical protein